MSESVRKTFSSRLSTVMETLLRAAVFEITRIFESTLCDSQLELARSRNEIDALKRRLEASEKHVRILGETGTMKRMGRVLGPVGCAPASGAGGELTVPRSGAGLAGKRPPLAGDKLTLGDGNLQNGPKQPKRTKDEGQGAESAKFRDTDTEVVSVIIKEEVVEQDSDPVVVEIRCAEKSGPGVRGSLPSAGHIPEGPKEGSQRGVPLKLEPTPNPTVSPRLSPTRVPNALRRPCVQDCSLQGFNGLRSDRRKPGQGCPETPPASTRERRDAGEALQCGTRTCRLTSVQQRSSAAEPRQSKHPPDSGTATFGPYQPCLPSVREIPEVNRAAESIQAQYMVKQGKATAPTQPQRQSVHSASGERPYSCGLCLKGFISPSHLNMHMRVHTGERPYCCPQCGMRFAQKGNLRAHQRQVHQGKRPFPCPECGKRFTKRGNLRTHQQQVHLGKRPFPCTECGKGYFSQKDLKVHQRVHGAE